MLLTSLCPLLASSCSACDDWLARIHRVPNLHVTKVKDLSLQNFLSVIRCGLAACAIENHSVTFIETGCCLSALNLKTSAPRGCAVLARKQPTGIPAGAALVECRVPQFNGYNEETCSVKAIKRTRYFDLLVVLPCTGRTGRTQARTKKEAPEGALHTQYHRHCLFGLHIPLIPLPLHFAHTHTHCPCWLCTRQKNPPPIPPVSPMLRSSITAHPL